MRAPDIRFALGGRGGRRIGTALLVVAAGMLAASLLQLSSAHRKAQWVESEYRKAVAEAERRRSPQGPAGSAELPAARVLAINAAIEKLNLPWAELFAALEQAKPDGVALLRLEPNGGKRSALIVAESRSQEPMIQFVARLREVAFFDDAFLVRHEVREDAAGRPYRFSLEIRWPGAHADDAP